MAYLTAFDTNELEQINTQVLVIGSGIAGLVSALECNKNFDVLLMTKSELMDTATWYAQGGIASAVSNVDSSMLHMEDTLKVGAGLSDKKAVKVLVKNGPDAIKYLQKIGAEFDRIGKELSLALEGGHSLPRIIHRRDATGSEVQEKLVKAVLQEKGIEVLEKTFAVDLLVDKGKCYGCLVYNGKKLLVINAQVVILATGGAGQLYSQTTNPAISTGDGMAMAYRAGATLMDMEFIQFHPTSLYEEEERHFLITEALRGAGAYIVNEAGERFLAERHPKAELASRDIVSQEILKEMKRFNKPFVFLDARHISKDKIKNEFPLIYQTCLDVGYDLSNQLIPVCPVAHFMIGGVKTSIEGKTNIEGLYAAGECACTGLHGANRLASNSLLEGIVYGKAISEYIKNKKLEIEKKMITSKIGKDKKILDTKIKKELQKVLFENAGIIRNKEGLEKVIRFINKEDYSTIKLNASSIELANMLITAKILATKALERKESRGVHFRKDYPYQKETYKKHSQASSGN